MCKALKIDVKLSIAFHSKTDDQSKIANQKMKRYLRSYCNYQQNDWFEWLFMTEFASNIATSAFTELFVFMTNYDFESKMSFDSSNSNDIFRERLFARERILTQKAANMIKKMKNIWDFIKKKLANTQDAQKKHADERKTISLEYKINDMIWLSIKNIKTKRSFRKLDHKWIDLFKIKKILRNACQLKLSQSMKIHNIFHTFLLRMTATNSLID